MCDICRGQANCPVCSDDEPDYEAELDEQLNLADDANKSELENGKDDN